MVQHVTMQANVIEKEVCVVHIPPLVTGASFMAISHKTIPYISAPQW